MSKFDRVAPVMMRRLRQDFPVLDVDDAAAIMGNAGHESAGLETLQEIGQTPPRGGYGWFQWTGPRRREYEAFCLERRLDPASDDTNYALLRHELQTTERRSIQAVHAEDGLYEKVVAFEAAFERAGVKHYDKRHSWARRALVAYNTGGTGDVSQPRPVEPPRGCLVAFVDLFKRRK